MGAKRKSKIFNKLDKAFIELSTDNDDKMMDKRHQ